MEDASEASTVLSPAHPICQDINNNNLTCMNIVVMDVKKVLQIGCAGLNTVEASLDPPLHQNQ